MHIFYSPEISNGNFFLDEEESRHAVKVLRLQPKDQITIVDGKGGLYTAEVTKPDHRKCEFIVIAHEKENGNKPYSVHVAIAPTKNADRIEWFTEKAVEIGIDTISFIQCRRSERKNINKERIEKIAVSAMKQSLKAHLPQISEMISFEKFLSSIQEEHKFIAHLEAGVRRDLLKIAPKNQKYCILIGPEGDFTPEEIHLAKEKGFISVSLGNSRLRTETAGVVACHLLNVVNSL